MRWPHSCLLSVAGSQTRKQTGRKSDANSRKLAEPYTAGRDTTGTSTDTSRVPPASPQCRRASRRRRQTAQERLTRARGRARARRTARAGWRPRSDPPEGRPGPSTRRRPCAHSGHRQSEQQHIRNLDAKHSTSAVCGCAVGVWHTLGAWVFATRTANVSEHRRGDADVTQVHACEVTDLLWTAKFAVDCLATPANRWLYFMRTSSSIWTTLKTQMTIYTCKPPLQTRSPGDGPRGDAVAADLALRCVHQRRRHLVEPGAEARDAARRRRRRARRLQGHLQRRPALFEGA